jgi:hypothetical protein
MGGSWTCVERRADLFFFWTGTALQIAPVNINLKLVALDGSNQNVE